MSRPWQAGALAAGGDRKPAFAGWPVWPGVGEELGGDDEKIAKGRGQYDKGQLAVVVIACRSPRTRFGGGAAAVGGRPVHEHRHAATAAGWGAWLTGWPAHDPVFRPRSMREKPCRHRPYRHPPEDGPTGRALIRPGWSAGRKRDLPDFLRALGQLGDGVAVILLGVALALALLFGLYALFLLAIRRDPGCGGPAGWARSRVHQFLGWASGLHAGPVDLPDGRWRGPSGLFIDDVAAVEARHYPFLPPAARRPFGLVETLNLLGLILVVNVIGLVVLLPLTGRPASRLRVNGLLLGREYMTWPCAACRTRMRKRCASATSVPSGWRDIDVDTLTVPVNLIVPVLGLRPHPSLPPAGGGAVASIDLVKPSRLCWSMSSSVIQPDMMIPATTR